MSVNSIGWWGNEESEKIALSLLPYVCLWSRVGLLLTSVFTQRMRLSLLVACGDICSVTECVECVKCEGMAAVVNMSNH